MRIKLFSSQSLLIKILPFNAQEFPEAPKCGCIEYSGDEKVTTLIVLYRSRHYVNSGIFFL